MNYQKTKFKETKGITLIALVITIIVLLILAGVTISALSGSNGILINASKAIVETTNSNVAEAIKLEYSEYQIKRINAEASINEPIKVASIANITIKGKQNHQLEGAEQTFMDYLNGKRYLKSGGIIDTEKLLGQKQKIGNGTGTTDVYIITEIENSYELKYYDKNSNPEVLWTIAKENAVATKNVDILLNGEAGFTIEYEEGMTWKEWIVSLYNTFGITSNEYNIYYTDEEGTKYTLYQIGLVFVEEEIENLDYDFISGPM